MSSSPPTMDQILRALNWDVPEVPLPPHRAPAAAPAAPSLPPAQPASSSASVSSSTPKKRKAGRPKKSTTAPQVSTTAAPSGPIKETAPIFTDSDTDGSDVPAVDEEDVVPLVDTTVKWVHTVFDTVDGDMRKWRPPEKMAENTFTGPTNFGSRHHIPTPGTVFRKFLPDKALDQFAAASTAYAASAAVCRAYTRSMAGLSAQVQKSNVYTRDDILRFFMCTFAMGIVQLPRVKMYWQGKLQQPYVKDIMSFTKYSALSVHLHWINTLAVPAAEQKAKNKEDGFWKLGDFVSFLSAIFQSLRVPVRDLTLDEFTIPLRGRHRCKCFNPNKPQRYHLKGFSLNEASTGYCLGGFMYQGRDEKRPPGVAATTWPTLKLLGDYKAVHRNGYILWADNWFSGLAAVKVCRDIGVDYVGTARANRLGGAFKGEEDGKKWERGKYRAKKAVVQGQEVWAIQWKDSKLVSVLSTVKSVVGETKRRMVDKKTKEYTNNPITIPSIYSAYNYGKVGTDRMDQQVGVYYKNRRLRWPVKTVVHLMYIALTNAHVSYVSLMTQTPLLAFIEAVIEELAPATGTDRDMAQAHSQTKTHTPITGTLTANTDKNTGNSCTEKMTRGNRGHCRVCKGNVSTRCKECQQWLHIESYSNKKKCWSTWHTQH